MKAVLLTGGLGTRMPEEADFRPKPMVAVGGKPAIDEEVRPRRGPVVRERVGL